MPGHVETEQEQKQSKQEAEEPFGLPKLSLAQFRSFFNS